MFILLLFKGESNHGYKKEKCYKMFKSIKSENIILEFTRSTH